MCRISALRDRDGDIVGLTYRIGRHAVGVSRILHDILAAMAAPRGVAAHATALLGAGAVSGMEWVVLEMVLQMVLEILRTHILCGDIHCMHVVAIKHHGPWISAYS